MAKIEIGPPPKALWMVFGARVLNVGAAKTTGCPRGLIERKIFASNGPVRAPFFMALHTRPALR